MASAALQAELRTLGPQAESREHLLGLFLDTLHKHDWRGA